MSVANVREALAPGVNTYGAIDPTTPLEQDEQPIGVIQQLGGLETFWPNQDRPFMDPETRAWFLLTLNNWRMVQEDQLTQETIVVDGNTQIVYGVKGTRQFTLEIRCESMAQDNGLISFNYMERLMTALKSQRGRDLLKASCLALVDFGANGIINVDEPVDQRWRSHSILEIEMYTGIEVKEEPSNLWIQKIIASADYGEGLGVSPAWLNHVIDSGEAAQP